MVLCAEDAEDTCPAAMIRTRCPPHLVHVGRLSGDGTTSPSTTYMTNSVPSASVWCSISYDCSQPCPHRMQAKE